MSVNVQLATELRRLSGQNVTTSQIMLALGYTPANDLELYEHRTDSSIHVSAKDRERWNNALGGGFSGNYNDLQDKPEIFEDKSGKLQFTDSNGNIIVQIDREGIKSVNFYIKGTELSELIKQSQFNIDYNNLLNRPDIYEDNSGKVSYADPLGNIIAEFSEQGLNTVGLRVNGTDIFQLVAQGSYSVDYNFLVNKPNIYDDNSEEMIVADNNGNIVARIDKDGINSIDVKIKSKSIAQIVEEIGFTGDYNVLLNKPNIENADDHRLIVTDDYGNIVAEIDAKGIRSVAFYSGSEAQDLATQVKNLLQTTNNHTGNNTIHITDNERQGWNTASTQVMNHTSNTRIHITDAERTKWNSISSFSGNYSDLTGAPNFSQNANGDYLFKDLQGNSVATLKASGALVVNAIIVGGESSNLLERITTNETSFESHKKDSVLHITTAERDNWNRLTPHINNTIIHIEAEERARWNAKSDFSGSYLDLLDKPNITNDEVDKFIFVDNLGNKIMQVDSQGLHVSRLEVGGVELLEELNGKAPAVHSHNYAGSGAPGGTANSAYTIDFKNRIEIHGDSNTTIAMQGTVCVEVPMSGTERMQFFLHLNNNQSTITTPYWYYLPTKQWIRMAFTLTDGGWTRAAVYYLGTQGSSELMETTNNNYPSVTLYFNT